MSKHGASQDLNRQRGSQAKKKVPAHGSRKRARVAVVTLIVMAGVLGLLLFQSKAERSPDTVGVAQYLLSGDELCLDDPLSLTAAVVGLELTGTSADGKVVGYSSNESVRQTCSRLSLALQSDGWILESDDGQGLLNFTKLSDGSQQLADASMDGSYTVGLFVQCVPAGGGSAVVVSRW